MQVRSYGKTQKKLRWAIVILAFFGIIINYVDRSALAAALPYMEKDLNLSAGQTGLILGLFFWTYSACQIPMGWVIDRLGPRFVFAFSCIWWSICTAATALTKGFVSLTAVRLLLGVGESGAFPSCVKVVSQWFPRHERARASGIYSSGARVGSVIALPIVTAVIAGLGWRMSFVVTGLLGVVWVVFWIAFYRSPRKHPSLSKEELEYIEEGGANTQGDAIEKGKNNKNQISMWDLLKNRTVWGITLGYSCTSYVLYFFITWFPTYLVKDLGFSLLKLGLFGMIPGIVAFFSQLAGGFVSDALVKKGFSISKARKICIVGGSLFAIVIGLAPFTSSPIAALVLLAISYGGLTFADASIWALPTDISPKGTDMSASIGGIMNSFSNFAGIVSPVVVGFLIGTTGSFAAGLFSAGLVAILGAICFIFATGKIEPIVINKNKDNSIDSAM